MKARWDDIRNSVQVCYNSIQHIAANIGASDTKDTLVFLSDALEIFSKNLFPSVKISVSIYRPSFLDNQRNIETIRVAVRHSFIEISFSEIFFKETLGALVLHRLLAPLTPIILAMAVSQNMDFSLYCGLGDDSDCSDYAACSADKATVLYPDSVFFYSGGYEYFQSAVESRWVDWDDRKDVVVWRGSTTGRRRFDPRSVETRVDDVTWLPRLDLCARFNAEPLSRVSDVGLSSIVQMEDNTLYDRVIKSGLIRPRREQIEYIEYKYLVDIDGNSNAWSNMFCNMLLGGCIFKINSENSFSQWYYNKMERGVHFIPVSSNLYDLEDVVLWGINNSADARRIAAAARSLAKTITFENAMLETTAAIIARFASN